MLYNLPYVQYTWMCCGVLERGGGGGGARVRKFEGGRGIMNVEPTTVPCGITAMLLHGNGKKKEVEKVSWH